MTEWTNYNQAGDLPADAVEKMWRALDSIAESCKYKHPANIDFLTKDQIRQLALRALPSEASE